MPFRDSTLKTMSSAVFNDEKVADAPISSNTKDTAAAIPLPLE
jgi:hypothetical protein